MGGRSRFGGGGTLWPPEAESQVTSIQSTLIIYLPSLLKRWRKSQNMNSRVLTLTHIHFNNRHSNNRRIYREDEIFFLLGHIHGYT